MAVGAALAIVGTAVSVIGQVEAADAKAGAMRAQAAANRANAADILNRAQRNVVVAQRQAKELKSSQVSGFAKAGVDVGSGSVLLFMEETAARARQDISNIQIDARLQANNIIRGASSLERNAGAVATAGAIGAAGTLLTGAAAFGDSSGLFGKKGP